MEMDRKQSEISALLARLDGEPHDAAAIALSAEDTQLAMQELQGLREQVRELPDVPVDQVAWRAVIDERQIGRPGMPRRAAGASRWHWQQFPMATAASVFFISALAVFGLFSGVGDFMRSNDQIASLPSATLPGQGDIHYASGESALISLMNRSRDLEQAVYSAGSWQLKPAAVASAGQQTGAGQQSAGLDVSPVGQFILYQLADIDERIARLHESEQMDESLRLVLWQQRVNLLQAFVAETASTNPGDFVDSRSM